MMDDIRSCHSRGIDDDISVREGRILKGRGEGDMVGCVAGAC